MSFWPSPKLVWAGGTDAIKKTTENSRLLNGVAYDPIQYYCQSRLLSDVRNNFDRVGSSQTDTNNAEKQVPSKEESQIPPHFVQVAIGWFEVELEAESDIVLDWVVEVEEED